MATKGTRRRAGAGKSGAGLSRGARNRRTETWSKTTPETIEKRLETILAEIGTGDPLKRLEITHEKADLQNELERMGTTAKLTELEAGFVAVASEYARRMGISYSAFRDIGVSAAVIARAGIARSALQPQRISMIAAVTIESKS